MSKVPLSHLKPHLAQMRTTYNLDNLAGLALQIYERGLNNWQPIVASPHGEAYQIVSGHRRQMAQLLALALKEWAGQHPDTEITIEVVRTMLTTLVESLGSLEKAIASLLAKYGDEEVEFVAFEGSQKAQILALQSANYGSEQPDMLGVAHSFRQALAAGATVAEIARNCGQHMHYVENHLALTGIPPELAQRIAAGELPMSVAAAMADLPEPKRTGLAIFILANDPGKVTAKAIKECAATLKKWPGLPMPLMVKHQAQRNTARALVRLWSQVVEAYPEDAYAAAAMLIYRELHEEPWASREKLTFWFQALGGDTYFLNGQIHWPAVVEQLITEVSCETCPLAHLPQPPLRADLSQGQGGPLGMPCRVNEAAARCIHGLAPDDPFDLRVPFAWSQHPGVVHEGGAYRVKSEADLLRAWQAQAEKERVEDAAEATGSSSLPAEAIMTTPARPGSPTAAPPGQAGGPGDNASPTPPAKDSPIARQRAQIAAFMQRHEQLAAGHPFATSCGRCAHRLEASPTKDETVPHCAWAGRLRNVAFKVLEPDDKNAPRIPVCRQFAPNQPWNELIPGHPHPPGVPRDWLKEQILRLVQDANRHGSDWNAFEFLTGRPMGANESYGDWFQQKLDAQAGDLSLEQLFTLFIWTHSEWQRAHHGQFSLPVNGHGVQFAAYREVAWKVTRTEA